MRGVVSRRQPPVIEFGIETLIGTEYIYVNVGNCSQTKEKRSQGRGRMNSKEREMPNLQMKEKLSHSPSTHDLSIQKIVLWNMQMKFPTF